VPAAPHALRVLEDLLVASLASDVDLGAAIEAHRAASASHAQEEMRAILDGGFGGLLRVARLNGSEGGLAGTLEDDLGDHAIR
jgi:hypothetical protein